VTASDTLILLGPGPSASRELYDKVSQFRCGAVGNAFQLIDNAEFLAASDAKWWKNHPDAQAYPADKYMADRIHKIGGIELVEGGLIITHINSGVLGLEIAKRRGATKIIMLGFDMHGTHFFGPYKNGCSNTQAHQREIHQRQYESWSRAHKSISVLNCTEGSKLRAFPLASLEAELDRLASSQTRAE
jgi:hypothetical protein